MSIHTQRTRRHQPIILQGMLRQPLPAVRSSRWLQCLQVTCSAVNIYAAVSSLAAGSSTPPSPFSRLPWSKHNFKRASAGHMAKHRQHTYPIPAAARRSAVQHPPKEQQQASKQAAHASTLAVRKPRVVCVTLMTYPPSLQHPGRAYTTVPLPAVCPRVSATCCLLITMYSQACFSHRYKSCMYRPPTGARRFQASTPAAAAPVCNTTHCVYVPRNQCQAVTATK
jgi:hypothetical protein